jgi:IS5 family transposase
MLRFRHLLEQHDLCGKMLDTVNLYLDSKGINIADQSASQVLS